MNDQQLQNLKIAAIAGAVVAMIYQLMFNMNSDGEGSVFVGILIAFLLFAAVAGATFFILDRMSKR